MPFYTSSTLTINNFHEDWADYHRTMTSLGICDGFRSFKRDMQEFNSEAGSDAINVVECNFDFTKLYEKGYLRGQPLTNTQVQAYRQEEADDYLQVFCKGNSHINTHLVDQNNVHFASVCWKEMT
ncbi:hypothetical protein CBS101457_000180 [Exobasidium rhododendri]|nr:hypothetical protein CBS101457_000180 [Exobasidium rhododendri]